MMNSGGDRLRLENTTENHHHHHQLLTMLEGGGGGGVNYKNYSDDTNQHLKYEEYFPPQEIFTNALRSSDLWKMRIPEYVPLTKYMLLSLMESMKWHPTTEHVCLMWVKPESHHQFCAYNLQIVHPKDLNNSSHFIVNKHGLLFFTNGFTEYISMDEFEREFNFFEQISQIKFFKQFRLWKGFIVWRAGLRKLKPVNSSLANNNQHSTPMTPRTNNDALESKNNIGIKAIQDQIMSTKDTLHISLDICELVQQHFRIISHNNYCPHHHHHHNHPADLQANDFRSPSSASGGGGLLLFPILSQLSRNNCLYTENQKKLLTDLLHVCRHRQEEQQQQQHCQYKKIINMSNDFL